MLPLPNPLPFHLDLISLTLRRDGGESAISWTDELCAATIGASEPHLRLTYEFRLQIDRADAVDLTCDIVPIAFVD